MSAASVDVRIKAVASTSMYDISKIREMAGLTKEQINHMKKQLCEQRWRDFENGESEYHPNFPEIPYADEDIPDTDSVTNEWNRFYATVRGHHPNALGGFTTTSDLVMLQFKCLDYVEEISPRPVLLIAGDRAHSKSFSEAAYAKAAEPKELYIVDGAEHIDLYDKTEFIPFEKLDDFFNKNL